MKISCDREQLLHAFQTVATVAPVRSPKPILHNVKLDVTASGATLTATDLEVGIRHDVAGVDVQAPGSVVLPVDPFGSILRESTDETLHIETDGDGTTIRGERSQFKLPAPTPTEFPPVAEFGEADFYEIRSRLLRELIRRTVFATDNESSRYALGGVKLEFDGDNRLTAVGTDGRRLAKMEGPAQRPSATRPPTAEARSSPPGRCSSSSGPSPTATPKCRSPSAATTCLVHSPRATIYSRLLEGRFPRLAQGVPRSAATASKIELAVGPFHAAVRQAAIVTSEESRGIDFTFGDGTLVLAGQAAEVGQSRVELPIGYDGPRDHDHARPAVRDRLPQGARRREDVHARAEGRRQRRRLHHRRRLRLRDHAAGRDDR